MNSLQDPPDEAENQPSTSPKGFSRFAARFGSFQFRTLFLHRPRRTKSPRPSHCLNCGDSLTGNYCANCGQEATDNRTALWPLISDALNEFARWDSKFFRTLAPLLFRPGYLTNEYIQGKRASYLAPFRLFLTVSVLFFLILSWHDGKSMQSSVEPIVTTSSSGFTAKQLTPAQAKQVQLQVLRAHHALAAVNQQNKAAASEVTNDINNSLDDVSDSIAPLGKLKGSASHLHVNLHAPNTPVAVGGDDGPAIIRGWNAIATAPPTTFEQLGWASSPTDWVKVPLLIPRTNPKAGLPKSRAFNEHNLPTTQRLYDALQANPAYPYKDKPLLQHIIDQVYWYGADHARIVSSFFDWTPKVALVLVPVFACLMYPLYLRTRRYYVEHLVFALHNHTFLFIVLTATLFSPLWLAITLWSASAVYMYAAMKVVYRQGWWKTLVKFWFISSNYAVCVGIAAVATILFALFV